MKKMNRFLFNKYEINQFILLKIKLQNSDFEDCPKKKKAHIRNIVTFIVVSEFLISNKINQRSIYMYLHSYP